MVPFFRHVRKNIKKQIIKMSYPQVEINSHLSMYVYIIEYIV